MTLADRLKSFLGGDVASDDATLTAYSRDASIFTVRPQVVVYPKDVDDVKQLVKFAAEKKKEGKDISLTPRSAGTDMSGGPLGESIVVDFMRYMNRIVTISKESATVQPGVFYRDFETETDRLGAMLPSYPASKGLCAIGGMVANNAAGEKTLAYGKTERYVTELKVVLEDGEEHVLRALDERALQQKMSEQGFEGDLYRKINKLVSENRDAIEAARPNVTKNSAGYYLWNVRNKDKKTFDLTQLIVGSQGTLGIVTEVTFRLVPKPKHSRMVVLFLKNFDPLTGLIDAILPFKPESFESYDDNTLKLAMRFLPDFVKILKTGIVSLAIRFLPEFFMVLRGGLPKMVLMAEFTGDDLSDIDRRVDALLVALRPFHVPMHATKDERESEKYWTVRRESFGLLRRRIKNKHTAPFIDDVVVRPEQLSAFLPRLNAILEPHRDKLTYTIAGHVGDGNFHIIPLMDLTDPAARALIPKLSDEAYALVKEFKGSITAEHNDGLVRSPYLGAMFSASMLGLFRQVKDTFDPLDIFNPHKKVGVDVAYMVSHISTENAG